MAEANNPELEPELAAVLSALRAPCPAPEGFADRVLARVCSTGAADELRRVVPIQESRGRAPRAQAASPGAAWLRSGIAAGLLLAVSLGGWLEHRRQERIAGERARQQALLALRIAGSAWRDVQQKAAFPHFHNQMHQENQP
jgi:hypothetical protein